MTELTPEQQREICETLARAMGWMHFPDNRWGQYWWPPDKDAAQSEPPDPFTSAADSRALLEWLTEQDEPLRMDFLDHLLARLGIGYGAWGPTFAMWMLTAPLPVIALAAHSAITEKR